MATRLGLMRRTSVGSLVKARGLELGGLEMRIIVSFRQRCLTWILRSGMECG
jgi:hypothetical protein